MDAEKLGKFIADMRKEKGLTQAELAEKIGVTDKAVSRWERGRGFPDISLLEPLASALEVSVTELLEGHRQDTAAPMPTDEVEQLVKKTIALANQPPKPTPQEIRRRIKIYVTFAVWGLTEAVFVWNFIPLTENAKIYLFVMETFGVLFDAYFWFEFLEQLPVYYDEYKIDFISSYGLKIHTPGLYYNNRNWPHILRALRIWPLATMALTPLLCAGISWAERTFGVSMQIVMLAVLLGGLFLPIYAVGKRFE